METLQKTLTPAPIALFLNLLLQRLLPLSLAILCSPLAQAQGTYPNKPLRMFIPFPPGGPADIIGRAAAFKLGDALGQQIVVENRGGAGGNIAVEAVAKAAPDGYTLLLLSSGVVANQSLYAKLPYSLSRDFSPVAPLASFPLLLAVHPSTKLSSVKELISLARSKPGVLNYGSAGSGGGAHLAAETFKLEARIDMVHVPYKGTGPAVLDLVAGQVNVMFASVPSVMQHVRAGKLNALAVTGTRRASTLPNIPTVSESGLPGYHMESWFGVMAPAGTPADIISRLNGLLGRIVQSSAFQERLVTEAGAPVSMGVEAYSEYVRNELARWAKIIKDTGARLE